MRLASAFVPLLLCVAVAVMALGGSASERAPVAAAAPTGLLLVNFDIQVDVGASDYVARAVDIAIANSQDLVIVMNTPGGLLSEMQKIVASIADVQSHGLRAFTYVPPNDFAASAGSYIALATDAVYMGDGSIIGPSTPIVVGGSPEEQAHVTGAMIAYMQALAQRNGYNVTAATEMVQFNRAFSAVDAVAVGLVTGSSNSLTDVLAALGLSSLPVTTFDEPFYDQFLSFLSNPVVDGLFILIGIVALVLDLFHQTLFLTIVAVIMIALGFLGAQIIGAPLVAIMVLVIAAALVILEVKAGHGMFALSGIVLGLAGTYLLAYGVGWSPSPYGVESYLVLGVAAGLLAVAFVYLAKIRKALMRQPKLVDPGRVVNMTGRAVTDVSPDKDGVVNVGAEEWTATSDALVEKGSLIRVTAYSEGRVHVEKARLSAEAPAPPKSDSSVSPP
jgi:membrane-bound serine protease (ClpP class)